MSGKKPTLHPYDTNDYLDLPDGVEIRVPITFKDRIEAVCGDVHHCTIANAITRQNVGIISLGRRGVSRSFVGMQLDRRVFPWAEPGRIYRGRLNARSADLVVELDDQGKHPRTQASTRRTLIKQAAQMPNGELTQWDEVIIVPPHPSERKGYRSSKPSGKTGRGTKRQSGIPRRTYKPDNHPVHAARRPLVRP